MVDGEELKELLGKNGADTAGFCRAEKMAAAPRGRRPFDLLPAAKSIIVFGISLNAGAVSNLPATRGAYLAEIETVNNALNTLGYNTVKYLEKRGFAGVAVPANTTDRAAARLAGDMSLRHAAAAAGLGLFGASGLILNEKFGARLRFGAVITSAVIAHEENKPRDLCLRCGRCAKACPAGALWGWEGGFSPAAGREVNKEKCYRYMFVHPKERGCGMCVANCPLSMNPQIS